MILTTFTHWDYLPNIYMPISALADDDRPDDMSARSVGRWTTVR
jgi:hypothetical protein